MVLVILSWPATPLNVEERFLTRFSDAIAHNSALFADCNCLIFYTVSVYLNGQK